MGDRYAKIICHDCSQARTIFLGVAERFSKPMLPMESGLSGLCRASPQELLVALVGRFLQNIGRFVTQVALRSSRNPTSAGKNRSMIGGVGATMMAGTASLR
jgi:hypothetical protein